MYTNHSWNVRNAFHNYLQHISQNIRCNIIDRYPPYTLRTPAVYTDSSYPHIHSQPRNDTNIHEHNEFPTTKQQQTYTGEINLPLRLTECTPTIRGMYATHFAKYSMQYRRPNNKKTRRKN